LLVHRQASPGGWTDALLCNGFPNVVSIDPAEMDAELLAKHGDRIEHLKMQAEDAAAALAGRRFSMMVCDVNAKSRVIAQKLLLPLAPMLPVGSSVNVVCLPACIWRHLSASTLAVCCSHVASLCFPPIS
jgi:predicted rRNA methylase YqxC with S4 and FtsJ domains